MIHINLTRLTSLCQHHKLHGSRFGNNSHAKFVFHRFVWNRHGCHSSTCIVWTSMLCALFKHECHMPVHIIRHECCVSIRIDYTWKSCTWFLCSNNAWHSCVNDMNPWNNKFHTYLEWTLVWTHLPYLEWTSVKN